MSTDLRHRDIVSINDLSQSDILAVLRWAGQLKRVPQPELLRGSVLARLFFEPSTRTRLSFEIAMKRLGGAVLGFTDKGASSSAKGESLADTIRIIGQHADVIVIRHPLQGSARLAAQSTDKPVINAGDGANQHPTQTLLDLFSIQETQKKLTGLSLALAGDLKYGRTVHSLAMAMRHFRPRLYFVAPKALQMPENYCEILRKARVSFSMHERIEEVIQKVDIFYLTRIQKERFGDPLEYERVRHSTVLKRKHLVGVKKNLKILHPLPRVDELDPAVDATSYAYYFEQAHNGLYVRQALLAAVLGKLR